MPSTTTTEEKHPCAWCNARLAKLYERSDIWLCRKHYGEAKEADEWLDKWVEKRGKAT